MRYSLIVLVDDLFFSKSYKLNISPLQISVDIFRGHLIDQPPATAWTISPDGTTCHCESGPCLTPQAKPIPRANITSLG